MTTGPPPSMSPLAPPLRRFAGGLHLHTTDLDDIPLDMFYYPPKIPSALPVMPHPPPSNPPLKVPATPVLPSSGRVSASSSPWVQHNPPPIPIPPPPSIPTQDLTPTRPLPSALEEALGNHPFRPGDTGNPTEDWEAKNHSGKPASSPVPERSFPPTPKVLPLPRMLRWEAGGWAGPMFPGSFPAPVHGDGQKHHLTPFSRNELPNLHVVDILRVHGFC